MGGVSIWHWLVLLIVLPLLICHVLFALWTRRGLALAEQQHRFWNPNWSWGVAVPYLHFIFIPLSVIALQRTAKRDDRLSAIRTDRTIQFFAFPLKYGLAIVLFKVLFQRIILYYVYPYWHDSSVRAFLDLCLYVIDITVWIGVVGNVLGVVPYTMRLRKLLAISPAFSLTTISSPVQASHCVTWNTEAKYALTDPATTDATTRSVQDKASICEPQPGSLEHVRPELTALHTPQIKAPRSSNFFARYWRGEVPLPISYWLVSWGLNLLVFATAAGITAAINDLDYNPLAILAAFVSIWAVILTASIWQFTGLWRSAGAYNANFPARKGWGYLARAFMIAGLFQTLTVFSKTGLLQIAEASRMTFQNDPEIPDFRLRISKDGTELSVSGGIKFGLAKEIDLALKLAPNVTVVELDSIGGRIGEAELIYDLISRRGLNTTVNGECASACTIVFASGRNRWMGPSARFGFHGSTFAGISDAEAAAANRLLLSRVASEKRISLPFLNEGFNKPSQDMWYPTREAMIAANFLTSTPIEANSSLAAIEAILLNQREQIISTLPSRVDEYTTFVDIIINKNRVFYVYDLTGAAVPYYGDHRNWNSIRANIREHVCKSDSMKADIIAGIKYGYLYRDKANARQLISYEIASC